MKFYLILLLVYSGACLGLHPNDSVFKNSWNEPKKIHRESTESLIPWDEIDREAWFNLSLWKSKRVILDQREKNNYTADYADKNELVGKIISCVGDCRINRGVAHFSGHYLSSLIEGDEIYTGKDSYAWIFMVDGSLVRLSPSSSLQFIEYNVSREKMIVVTRLARGHMIWESRSPGLFTESAELDRDKIFLPLHLIEANREFIFRMSPKRNWDGMDLVYLQYQELNLALRRNNLWASNKKAVEHILVLPNATLEVNDATIEAYYPEIAGKSYIRHRAPSKALVKPFPIGDVYLSLRGYERKLDQREKISLQYWYLIKEDGASFDRLQNGPTGADAVDDLLDYNPTIWMAREIFLNHYSRHLFDPKIKREIFEKKHGYRLWEERIDDRKDYLLKQVNRQETANLVAIKILQEKGGWFKDELLYFSDLNKLAVEASASKRYLERNELVEIKKMSAGEFYYWILSESKGR